jgi:hypothetical protein
MRRTETCRFLMILTKFINNARNHYFSFNTKMKRFWGLGGTRRKKITGKENIEMIDLFLFPGRTIRTVDRA